MAPAYLDSVITNIVNVIVGPLIFLLIGLALVYFLYGVMIFLMNFDDESERERGKRHMIWGIAGLFIMIGVFGIIEIFADTFGIDAGPIYVN